MILWLRHPEKLRMQVLDLLLLSSGGVSGRFLAFQFFFLLAGSFAWMHPFPVLFLPLVKALSFLEGAQALPLVFGSLEKRPSRWVVLDAGLNLLEQNVIYANAQQGEWIAIDLAQRHISN